MAKLEVAKFAQEVRQEASKVTWPSRKEVTLTTTMVFIMVVLMSVFFFFVDSIIAYVTRLVLGLGS